MELINKKICSSEEKKTHKEIEEFESKNNIALPSDFKSLVIQKDGLEMEECYYITFDGEKPINELRGVIGLNYLSSNLDFYKEYKELWNQDMLSNYIPFAETYSQGTLFMGKGEGRENKIYYFDPSVDDDIEKDIVFVAENYVDFFNNNLMPEEEADIWILKSIENEG